MLLLFRKPPFFVGLFAFFLSLIVVVGVTQWSVVLAAEEYPNPLAVNGQPVTDFNALLTAFLLAMQRIVAFLSLVFLVLGALIYITSTGDEGRITWAKGAIFAAALGLAIAIAAPLFLNEIGRLLGWTSEANIENYGTTLTLTEVLANVLSFLLAIIGVVAIIALVIGGFMYLTSAGEADRADAGKGIVKYAIIGIVVALAGLVIITQVAKFFA